jgi:hypothetical protein
MANICRPNLTKSGQNSHTVVGRNLSETTARTACNPRSLIAKPPGSGASGHCAPQSSSAPTVLIHSWIPTQTEPSIRPIRAGNFRRASYRPAVGLPGGRESSRRFLEGRALSRFVSDYFPPLALISEAPDLRGNLDALAEYSLRSHCVSAKPGRFTAPGHAAAGRLRSVTWLVHAPLHFRTAETRYGTEEKLGHLTTPGEPVEILDQFFHHAFVLQFKPSLCSCLRRV